MPGTLELWYVWRASCGKDVQMEMKDLVSVLAEVIMNSNGGQ
jgi:hypothetical protein